MAEVTFKFHECVALTRLTGRKASDILELLEIIKNVSPDSIFHHMHQYFLKPHVIPPEFPNDFAVWVSEALGERGLAEGLANLNPYGFSNIEDVRAGLVRIITEYLNNFPAPRPVLPGEEFFFNEGVTFIIPTGLEALHRHDMVRLLKEVDSSSIYFHFYEARMRLGKQGDDFSQFLEQCLDCHGLANRIKALDPYMYTTEVLRNKLIDIMGEGL